MTDQLVSARLSESLKGLRNRVGIVGGLADRGVRTADIPELAVHAVKDACIVTNPRHAGLADVEAIYGDAI
jgi:alcohol dehydrogenase